MRALLVVALCVACGKPAPAPAPPSNTAAVGPVDASIADACAHPCLDTCCEADEACSHAMFEGQMFAKCVRH